MKIFRLKRDLSSVRDADFHANLVDSKKSGKLRRSLANVRDLDLQEPLALQGDLQTMEELDYPHTNLGNGVMSRRMYELVQSHTLGNHRTIGLVVIDDTHLDPSDQSGQVKDEVKTIASFLALQLLEHVQAFDQEKSEFEESTVVPGAVSMIHQLVLREPDEGFPSLFRIPEYKSDLFVTEVLKVAFEEHKITGCLYEEVKVTNS